MRRRKPPAARPRGRLREWALNLVVLLVTLFVGCTALEIGLRLLGARQGDWYAAGPQRLAFLRDHVSRNADGFRDREFSAARRPGTRRILAVGDSFTFGDGIEQVEQTWPRVLERELAARAGPHEVYNLGVPGTNTAFQRRMLGRRDAWRFRPDRLVLGFVLNDPEPPGANRTIVTRRLYPPLLPPAGLDSWLTRRSYAWAWLRRTKNTLAERWGLKETYGDYVEQLFRPETPDWEAFVHEARGLVDDARQRGVPVTVAIFPMFHDLEHYRFEEQHRRAAAVFREAGADVIDLLEVFRGRPTAELHVAPGDAHPNARAHRIAAEAIAGHLSVAAAASGVS